MFCEQVIGPVSNFFFGAEIAQEYLQLCPEVWSRLGLITLEVQRARDLPGFQFVFI